MATPQQIDLAKKYWYTQSQIDSELQRAWVAPLAPATVEQYPNLNKINPNKWGITPLPWAVTPDQVQAPAWATYWEQSILPPSVTGYGTTPPKPTIATTDTPVIGNQPATTPAPIDFTTATPEQLKAQYMTIGTKLPWEVTDEDRRFAKYLQTRMALGETMDKIFGTSTSKSSWTTTYSTQLNRSPEQYQSSVKNADGTWTVTYKDGATQVITENPTKTTFPEGTPEYFAQKQADEAEKRVQDLTNQMNTESERRKTETADLVAKYGENIATQFQTQKADIEANGAKRMETLNSGLSFSGFGRSTLALDKRDEIAKNIETTINQAKAKADLELMAFRMEREWADASAIDSMRKNIAQVQSQIDDANYANQLEIIKLNQENATTGSEAMNNFLETISNSAEIVSNADLDKSQELGYFVDKNGALMLDSQKRPIQFEGTASWLTPDQIKSYSDAISKWVIKAEDLDKTLTPAQKADILKDVAVQNGTYMPPTKPSGQTTMAKIKWKTVILDTVAMDSFQKAMAAMPENTVIGAQQYRTPEQQAKLKAEWKSWTLDSNHMKGMAVDIYDGDPSKKPSDIQIQIMNQNWWFQDPALLAKGDYGHFDYKGVGWGTGGQGGGVDVIASLSPSAKAVIDQINQNGGKPQDYILGTSKDSQALLDEVLKGLNSQWGSGTLASDTRKQSLALATNTIEELLKNKDFAGSFQTRRVWDTWMGSVFNLTANENVNFVNRVDALAWQLMQIDWPTLKAIFWPQISNSDIEMIKKTILQGLDPKNQNPAAFEKTLNDVKAKMQAYINRLPTGTPTGNTGTTAPAQNMSTTTASDWDF